MLLGALLGAGAPLDGVQAAVASLGVPVQVESGTTERAGLTATCVRVTSAEQHPPHRKLLTTLRGMGYRFDP